MTTSMPSPVPAVPSGDPNEAEWLLLYASALASGLGPDEARVRADGALAVYVQRWPRGREVVTRAEALADVEAALERGRAMRREALRSFAGNIAFALRNAHVFSGMREDIAIVLQSLVDPILELGRVVDQRPGQPLCWQPPETREAGLERLRAELEFGPQVRTLNDALTDVLGRLRAFGERIKKLEREAADAATQERERIADRLSGDPASLYSLWEDIDKIRPSELVEWLRGGAK